MFHPTEGQKNGYCGGNRLKRPEYRKELLDDRRPRFHSLRQDRELLPEQADFKNREGHIAVCPAGRMEAALLDAIVRGISRRLRIRARVSMALEDLMFAHNMERKQYCSTDILGKLAEMAEPSAVKVLAVTHVDLFIPALTYVTGEAQLGGRSCIISTFRFRGDDRQGEGYIDGIVKGAVHELCHTFDLRHCKDPSCVMHRSANEVGGRPDTLCRYCSIIVKDRLKRFSSRASLSMEPPGLSGRMNTDIDTCTAVPSGEEHEEYCLTDRDKRIMARRGVFL